eukprot:TRINITY_DN21278_c0_g1_i1.p1 TRINITY_DN21278_c0_g1~~TRINITY_DN21278_c0_g1_i1.p1  ORF type:complete len:687 (-),score=142.36 TRINITY_DN21278_c0_g1_i1:180-2003(-)
MFALFRGGEKYRDFLDEFPFMTSDEYYDYLMHVFTEQGHDKHLIRCTVEQIEESDDMVTLNTTEGTFTCDKLVYDVPQKLTSDVLSYLKEAHTMENKTVLLNGMGDTSNMLISILALNGNTVYLNSRSFFTLEKIVKNKANGDVILDNYEEHWMMWNLRNNFARNDWTCSTYFSQSWLRNPFGRIGQIIARVPPMLTDRNHQLRTYSFRKPGYAPDVGGTPAKYWGVENYFNYLNEKKWKNHMLDNNILLNDVWFFMQLGIVKPCTEVTSTEDKSTYLVDGKSTTFDKVWSMPLVRPKTASLSKNGKEITVTPQDMYKNMMHSDFKRVFFCGAIRPAVGGFAVLAESQALFFKDIFQNKAKWEEYHANLPCRIQQQKAQHVGGSSIVGAVWSGYWAQGILNELGYFFKWQSEFGLRQNLINLWCYVLGPTSVAKIELLDSGYKDKRLIDRYNKLVIHCTGSATLWASVQIFFKYFYLPNEYMLASLVSLGRLAFAPASCVPNVLMRAGYYFGLDSLFRRNLEFANLHTCTELCYVTAGATVAEMLGKNVGLKYIFGAQCMNLLYRVIRGDPSWIFNYYPRKNPSKFISAFNEYREDYRRRKAEKAGK